MVAQTEREKVSGPGVILELLEQFNIPTLPPLDVLIRITTENGGRLALTDVLGSPPEKYLEVPLNLLAEQREKTVEEKPHGRPRNSAEKKGIRDSYKRMENQLRVSSPGWLLSAIALNNEAEAKWTMNGVTGNENWQDPSEAEKAWWVWLYLKEQNGVDVKQWWENGTAEMFHAVFIMRHRITNREVTPKSFGNFVKFIEQVIPEGGEVEQHLRGITQLFTA